MTDSTKQKDIKREYHLIDLDGEVLGRISTKITNLLMGKSKPYFVRNLDCGDFVVAINASKIKTTGKKDTLKVYYRYSGYPGGLTQEKLKDLKIRKPDEVIRHAVRGMLPQNRLRDDMLKRLLVYKDSTHPHQDKFNK